MATMPSEYDLTRCFQTIAAIETELGRLTANLTECQFHAPPRTGGWSIGHCLEHLILTGNAFLVTWDAAIEAAVFARRQSDGPFPYSWLGRRILHFSQPPFPVRVKDPPPLCSCLPPPLAEN